MSIGNIIVEVVVWFIVNHVVLIVSYYHMNTVTKILCEYVTAVIQNFFQCSHISQLTSQIINE